jgi:hypothetical protein
MIANIRKGLEHVLQTTPQLPKLDRWKSLVRYIVNKIVAAKSQVQKIPLLLGVVMPQQATG